MMTAEPRKSFSGRGRKAKGLVPLREAAGQLQRPPNVRQEAAAEVVASAVAQPHRRFAENARAAELATPVGRLIHSGVWCSKDGPRSRMAELLVDAAKRYSADYAGWQWANESRRAWKNATWRAPRVFATQEEEDKAVLDSIRKWADTGRAIRDVVDLDGRKCGERCGGALQSLILDAQSEDWKPPYWIVFYGEIGVRALVNHYGLAQKG
jgi:hypothetical protein